MAEEMYYCSCGFKCIKATLAKSKWNCPKCEKAMEAR